MSEKLPPGMRDLAKATGFSVATVSRALRGLRDVNERTRATILAAVEELGYEFNPYVSQLMASMRARGGSQFKGNLALLWYDISPAEKHPWLAEIRRSVFERAGELGYSMDEFHRKNHRAESLTKMMLSRGITGVLISPALESLGKVHMRLPMDAFACVSLGWSLYHPEFNRVRFDHFQAIRLAVHYARKKFYRAVAALFDLRYDRRADGACRAGFLAHHPAGAHVARNLIFDLNNLDVKRMREAFESGKFRGLISQARGQVPREVLSWMPRENIIYLDDPVHSGALGVIDYRYDLLGRWGVDLLVATLQKNERGVPEVPMTIYVPPRWIACAAQH